MVNVVWPGRCAGVSVQRARPAAFVVPVQVWDPPPEPKLKRTGAPETGSLAGSPGFGLAVSRADAVRVFQPQHEVARWRVRTSLTRAVIRLVLHRSFRRSRQAFRVAMACSPTARMRAWEMLTAR